ncbi:MAG: DUF4293 domain-containing protein [Saprospiraceae bacterium]|nr:DUF4293 domain-containing protein [Saprospiraceae bacterium]MDA9299279.1 DUF4293 domain-containing protein [Saprospiraceae bacterium]MDA9333001.1 DUF4293 domain-containing protein [Saprospiraceae bacterium]MDA9866502.1 DUF4293 domain-containing protein [Saprospiraceae bacterium]MDG1100131.1 DUF4293 domain-containing protein [Saprospiraceae bacterium]
MIQRIQSLFLLLSSAAFWTEFALPFATTDVASQGVMNDLVYNIHDSPVLIGLTIIGGLVTLSAIFLFNNRPLQKRLSYLGVVMAILLPLIAFLLIYNERTGDALSTINYDLGIFPPLVALIFAVLAGRAIGKDDKLVKSMDRLR